MNIEWCIDYDRPQFNLAAYFFLTSIGYQYVQREPTWEDEGDGESGPHLTGGPEYDEFIGPDEIIYISADGTADREARDLAREAYERDNVS